ncbi:hypothetical protein L2750_15300 [Shewanella submarina]|uniref:Uncharacterized protein n=1 Tax=Shewanella submarina TaxID=2016376 RepID=A0ABV7GBH9_9GAMM|nr:hypothetical protein [Shewanella submarina]MCL1038499.1 hypothetical protein [Shewanella submarina]
MRFQLGALLYGTLGWYCSAIAATGFDEVEALAFDKQLAQHVEQKSELLFKGQSPAFSPVKTLSIVQPDRSLLKGYWFKCGSGTPIYPIPDDSITYVFQGELRKPSAFSPNAKFADSDYWQVIYPE